MATARLKLTQAHHQQEPQPEQSMFQQWLLHCKFQLVCCIVCWRCSWRGRHHCGRQRMAGLGYYGHSRCESRLVAVCEPMMYGSLGRRMIRGWAENQLGWPMDAMWNRRVEQQFRSYFRIAQWGLERLCVGGWRHPYCSPESVRRRPPNQPDLLCCRGQPKSTRKMKLN